MKKYSFVRSESFMIPILDSGAAKVVQISFPKGKILDRHKAPSSILIFVIGGKIKFNAGDESQVLDQGDMISLDKNIEHSLEALEESVVALVLTPSPSSIVSKPTSGKSASEIDHPVIPAQGAISPQLFSFVEEHADLLQILDRAQKNQDVSSYMEVRTVVGEELDQHFRYEEEILFPLLGKYIGTSSGPIAVMLAEHKIIRENYNQFQKVFSQVSDVSEDVQHLFLTLANPLRTHIMKEDNVLFPMASQVMSAEDQDEVARRVSAEKQVSESKGTQILSSECTGKEIRLYNFYKCASQI